jgi:hypothetical protein
VPEVKGGGCSVDWSVPTGVNRSPRSSGTPGHRVVPGNTLVVDLTGARFMGSSHLDVLLRARRRLATIDSTIPLRSPHERVLKLLEVSSLDRVFPVEFVRGPNDNHHDPGGPGKREGRLAG